MLEVVLTIIGFAAAMTVPAFLTAIVESAAFRMRPASVQINSVGGRRKIRRAEWRDTPRAVSRSGRAMCKVSLSGGRSWRSA